MKVQEIQEGGMGVVGVQTIGRDQIKMDLSIKKGDCSEETQEGGHGGRGVQSHS